jgi:hypothetical protein
VPTYTYATGAAAAEVAAELTSESTWGKAVAGHNAARQRVNVDILSAQLTMRAMEAPFCVETKSGGPIMEGFAAFVSVEDFGGV